MTTEKQMAQIKANTGQYFIPLSPVKGALPPCYGKRANFDGGPCIGCMVYVGCLRSTQMYLELVELGRIPA